MHEPIEVVHTRKDAIIRPMQRAVRNSAVLQFLDLRVILEPFQVTLQESFRVLSEPLDSLFFRIELHGLPSVPMFY